jgi:hypothetical protein
VNQKLGEISVMRRRRDHMRSHKLQVGKWTFKFLGGQWKEIGGGLVYCQGSSTESSDFQVDNEMGSLIS